MNRFLATLLSPELVVGCFTAALIITLAYMAVHAGGCLFFQVWCV